MTKAFDSPEEAAALNGAVQEFSLRGIEFKAKPKMAARDFGALGTAAAGASDGDLFLVVSNAIRNTLLPGYRQKWDELLAEDLDIPIEFKTLYDIGGFLMEGATGRPTQLPSPSGSTGGSISTESTDGSDSLAGRVSPTSIREPV